MGISQYSALNNSPIFNMDPLGDTLSNSQLLGAAKIASGEINDAIKNNRGFFVAGTNERLLGAANQYAKDNKLSTSDAFDFISQVAAYHDGLASVAMKSSEEFAQLNRSVINNDKLTAYQALNLTIGYIYHSDAQLRSILNISANVALGEAAGAIGVPVGRGPRGPYEYGLEDHVVPKYDPRVRARGVEDPTSHNFPYSFDKQILQTKPILQNSGYRLYRMEGEMMGSVKYDPAGLPIQTWKKGVFEIGVTKEGIINHRFFRPY